MRLYKRVPAKGVERRVPRLLHREEPRRAARRLKEADDKLAEEIKAQKNALDIRSKDNRDKRKTLQGVAPALNTRLARYYAQRPQAF